MTSLLEEVRPIGPADAHLLGVLEEAFRTQVGGARGGAAWLAETPAVGDWSVLVDDPAHPAWAAAIDGLVVGYLELCMRGTVAEVRQVYVQPEARELGLGDALLAAAIDTARAAGCTRLEGTALPGDRHTKNLYERAGVVARKIVVSTGL